MEQEYIVSPWSHAEKQLRPRPHQGDFLRRTLDLDNANNIRAEAKRVGFPDRAREPEKTYFLKSFFLPKPARPIKPVPRRSMVAGSGTD